MSDSSLYTERLMSYWDQRHVRFGWKHGEYTHIASMVGDLCGDEVDFRLVIDAGVLDVVDVWARGCCIAEAGAVMLAELARGKPLAWLDAFTDQDWIDYVNIPIGEHRKKSCLLLPLECLRKAVSNA